MTPVQPIFVEEETQALAQWCHDLQPDQDATGQAMLAAARQIVAQLGGHVRPDGLAQFGFWAPELDEQSIPPAQIRLTLFLPPPGFDPTLPAQTARFERVRLPVIQAGEYVWCVAQGVPAGRRDHVGAFYWLTYQDRSGRWQRIVDPLAHSVPFGAYAPAELYDMAAMFADRADADYFRSLKTAPDPDGVPRIQGPVNMMEIHTNTATAQGTLAALTARYAAIARKIEADEILTPAEENYIGYDAVQLMPIEPTIVYEAGPHFWQSLEDDGGEGPLTVKLHRPDTTNWGYDVITVASPAPNPIVLASARPDELLDFITTLHTFPIKPIKVVLDVVYGHADNQTLPLMNRHYFAGANMYGQNINYKHPVVRAVILEMQRRKSDYGVDGVRVDGAQDFKYWLPAEDRLYHDDDFLGLMNDVTQEVAGVRYRPWMIFEDGRPWPRDDWELASSYREVTKQFPNVVQWGPLTFAHNTPFLYTFWITKWWRIREMLAVGSHWITGTSNHDTLRRGTQVDPIARINSYLGANLPEIFENAYDNPATHLFDAFMPGVIMDFLNANMRGPWSFIRNTDDRWGVKVVSEEAFFLDWNVTEARFAQPWAFPRLKLQGFESLEGLRRFLRALASAVRATEYDLAAMAQLLNSLEPALDGPRSFNVANLKAIARDWMDDVHEFCNVSHYEDRLDPERTAFNLEVREFRRMRPWLVGNLRQGDSFDYLFPTSGTVLFHGLRTAPDRGEQLLFVANMEGAPCTVIPAALPIPGLREGGWQLALATPGLDAGPLTQPVTLANSQGVIYWR